MLERSSPLIHREPPDYICWLSLPVLSMSYKIVRMTDAARPFASRLRSSICAGALVCLTASPALAGALKADGVDAAADALSPAGHFDPSMRIFYIGGSADSLPAAAPVRIVTGRITDIAGRPLRAVQRMAALASPANGRSAIPFSLPFSGRAMTSGFGMREHPILGGWRAHTGIDLAAAAGTPITATSDGVVTTANWAGGYGLLVSIDHGMGVQTRYGHMSGLNVMAGQHVRKGDVIGYVGSTGRSTGPHVHYEVRINGRAVNPISNDLGR